MRFRVWLAKSLAGGLLLLTVDLLQVFDSVEVFADLSRQWYIDGDSRWRPPFWFCVSFPGMGKEAEPQKEKRGRTWSSSGLTTPYCFNIFSFHPAFSLHLSIVTMMGSVLITSSSFTSSGTSCRIEPISISLLRNKQLATQRQE